MADRASAPIYSYRHPEDRELMARHWCEQRYGGKLEAAEEVQRDLEQLDVVALAYLWRECANDKPIVQRLPDNYDPWRCSN
jgi:hypothetical protein